MIACVLALVLLVATPMVAQDELPAAETPTATAAGEASAPTALGATPADPLGRGSPRGAMAGYLEAARKGDFERAADYLDLRRLPSDERAEEGPELARRLLVVLDRVAWIELDNLATTNAGTSEDGLPFWRDRLAQVETKAGSVELLLQRVPRNGDDVRIWKVSSDTVARIDALYDEFGHGPLGELLPPVLVDTHVVGLPLWQWMALVAAVLAAWALSWVLASLLILLVRPLARRTATKWDDRLAELVSSPTRLVIGVLLFRLACELAGMGPVATAFLRPIESGLLIVAAAWFAMRLIDLGTLVVRDVMPADDKTSLVPLLGPGQKIAKLVVILLCGVAILDNAGFNVGALIAGLGVTGLAVALAAQKSLENLFGGATLFADRPVRVGDFCKFGDQVGTVESIGLRSTRVRTLDRTVITIPNSSFSEIELENYTLRDQIRLYTVIGLRYETSSDQLRYVLARIREMLLGHPAISKDPARARFVSFGAHSLDIEIFAYARTSDWNEFMRIREDVFLRLIDIVEEAGTGFAFPSSTVYLGRDTGLDAPRREGALKQVEEWRAGQRLPFPDFAAADQSGMLDRLDWPPQGSPAAGHRHTRSEAGD